MRRRRRWRRVFATLTVLAICAGAVAFAVTSGEARSKVAASSTGDEGSPGGARVAATSTAAGRVGSARLDTLPGGPSAPHLPPRPLRMGGKTGAANRGPASGAAVGASAAPPAVGALTVPPGAGPAGPGAAAAAPKKGPRSVLAVASVSAGDGGARAVAKALAAARARAAGPERIDLGRAKRQGQRLVVPLRDGEAVLTLLPRVHERLVRLLQRYDVPYGAFAAVEPRTGRVLALASHSAAEPKAKPFALRSKALAASVFKLVTAGALLELSDLDTRKPYCYRGGKRRLYRWNLEDSRKDYRCATLPMAVARSLNAPIAKMALKHLTPASLTAAAEAFGFNLPIPFELEVEPSWAKIPTDMVGFGRAAAGFGDVRLTALHGALVAAAIGNGGLLMRPYVVETRRGRDGRVRTRGEPEILSIALSEPAARRVGEMMLLATTRGSARRHLRRGRRSFLADIPVAAKTGSLFAHNPFIDYSWLVGYAPADDPQIAFAAVIGNTPLWHIRAGYVAVEGLRKFFEVETTRHRPPRARR